MYIKKIRYFFAFLDLQEDWLNKMGQNGYKLVYTDKLNYSFEKTDDIYDYKTEYIAHKSKENVDDYIDFLESLNYTIFKKNININHSIGKIKLRLFAEKGAKIATKSNTLDKELLIVYKKSDAKPFHLHTSYDDLIEYYRPVRNTWLSILLLSVFIAVFSLIQESVIPNEALLVGIMSLVPTIMYQIRINKYKSESTVIDK